MPKARRDSDGLGSGLARARGVAAGLFVESKWILTIKSVVSHGDKFEFVSQGDKFCPRARPCFQRNCGAEEWTASRCQPRGGARAGPLAERIMRRSKARPQRRYRALGSLPLRDLWSVAGLTPKRCRHFSRRSPNWSAK